MFQWPLQELQHKLDRILRRVANNQWQGFAQEAVPFHTTMLVNTLMQQFQGMCSPLSKYVLWSAYDNCRGNLVNSMKAVAHATNNPALKGWAFELEQIELIRLSLESQESRAMTVRGGDGLAFQPKFEANFSGDTIQLGLDQVGIQDATVIWCMKWNQGCFDVANKRRSSHSSLQHTRSAL